MKEKVLVSACLLGVACRYDGKSVPSEKIIALRDKYEFIPFCPEIYGGLSTPRTPSERVGDEVIMNDGTVVTENYEKGANEALRLARLFGVKLAILKEKSPSCGSRFVYDGSFTGRLSDGEGVTAELLRREGIRVVSELDFE